MSEAMDRKVQGRPATLRRIVWAGLVVVGLSVSVLSLLSSRSSGKRLRVEAGRLRIAVVTEGEFEEFVAATGTVVPVRTVYLDAIEGGRIESIFVEEGSLVRTGEELLKLNDSGLLLDIMYREAELFQQSNNLRNTSLAYEQHRNAVAERQLQIDHLIRDQRRELASLEGLARAGLIADNELHEAREADAYLQELREMTLASQEREKRIREDQQRRLRADLERMETNFETAGKNLENLVVKAPVSGQLTSLEAEIGQTKARGERLGRIDVLDGFKVSMEVDEHYVERLARGQIASVDLSEGPSELVVERISPEVREGRCEVSLQFLDPEPKGLRRGQSLRLRLRLADPVPSLLLERGGFFQETGGRWVFVLDQDGKKAARRKIRLGFSNPDFFQVLDGLAIGERVVVSSYEELENAEELILLGLED